LCDRSNTPITFARSLMDYSLNPSEIHLTSSLRCLLSQRSNRRTSDFDSCRVHLIPSSSSQTTPPIGPHSETLLVTTRVGGANTLAKNHLNTSRDLVLPSQPHTSSVAFAAATTTHSRARISIRYSTYSCATNELQDAVPAPGQGARTRCAGNGRGNAVVFGMSIAPIPIPSPRPTPSQTNHKLTHSPKL
jgi:hypothetical protein